MHGKEVSVPALRMQSGKVKVLAAICAFGLSTTAWSQSTETNVGETSLNKIVVTASGHEQEIKDAPASISVITREDIEDKGYTNINDALKDVPGVIVDGGDITIRGMGAGYTLILIDGKRQSSRETRPNSDGPNVESNWTPPLAAIERIEVIRGPMSSLYGSDAMGGVINVITRKVPKKWTGEIRTEASIQTHDQFGDNYNHSFYLAGPIKSDLLGLQLYGKYNKRMEDKVLNGNNGRENTDINAKLALTPNKNHDIELLVSRDRQNNETSEGKTLAAGTADANQNYRESKTALSHTGRWGWGVSDSFVQIEEAKNLTRNMKWKELNAQSSWTIPYANHVTTLGAVYTNQKLNDHQGGQIPILDLDRYQWAVFAEDEWRITKRFALTGGLRYDNNEKFGDHYSPRIYGVWHVDDAWTVKGGVSTGFKVPGIRYASSGIVQTSRGGNIWGNPDLKPEKSVSEEIGVLYDNSNGFNASATIFNNQFKDKLNRITCTTGACATQLNAWGRVGTTQVNVDKAITRGIELSTKWALTTAVSMTASYTYTKSEQKSGQYKGLPLTQLPKHLLALSGDWRVTDKIKTWAKVTYRGEESQPTSTPSSSTIIAPSYTVMDLGGSYKFNKSLTAYAGIYNLFDKEITYDDYGYYEDGRRFWVGLGMQF